MTITLEEAILMYARACRAWWRHNAASQAAMKAKECARSDDQEGVGVWLRVKAEVERLDKAGVPHRIGSSAYERTF
jgi:hypothetical protein